MRALPDAGILFSFSLESKTWRIPSYTDPTSFYKQKTDARNRNQQNKRKRARHPSMPDPKDREDDAGKQEDPAHDFPDASSASAFLAGCEQHLKNELGEKLYEIIHCDARTRRSARCRPFHLTA